MLAIGQPPCNPILFYSVAEQEQDAMLEKERKEREIRRKKEEDNTLTIEQTKEQVHLNIWILIEQVKTPTPYEVDSFSICAQVSKINAKIFRIPDRISSPFFCI